MPEGTQGALTKISRAIDRGTLPGLELGTKGGVLAVILPDRPPAGTRRPRGRVGHRQPSDPALLAWFEKNFPGGRHRLSSPGGRTATRHDPYPGLDRHEYQVSTGIGSRHLLWVRYSRLHVHHQVRVQAFVPEDLPTSLRWTCVSCGTVLTGTEIAALGLPVRTGPASADVQDAVRRRRKPA